MSKTQLVRKSASTLEIDTKPKSHQGEHFDYIYIIKLLHSKTKKTQPKKSTPHETTIS